MSGIDLPLTMLALLGGGGSLTPPQTVATDLRCEYLVDPLGLDVVRPRLSWKLVAVDPDARGLRQTGYRILVASSAAGLARDEGDLWDSGRVASDLTTHVAYDGAPLSSRTQCHWKVRSWTGDDAPSAWSAPARWTMGLLSPEDWTARWIGAAPRVGFFGQARWIWFPEGDPAAGVPAAGRFFRRSVRIPGDRHIVRAEMRISADDLFALLVNGQEVATGRNWDEPVIVDLAEALRPGENVLAAGAVNVGAHDNPAGLIAHLEIELDDGAEIVVVTDASWRAGEKRVPGWDTDLADPSGWRPARELGPYGMGPWGTIIEEATAPEPWLRRTFVADGEVARATAYVASLGYHELWMNGERVGEQVLTPAVADLSQRARYVTYDLGAYVRPGPNTLAMWLGSGWSHFPQFGVDGGPLALAQVEIENAEGKLARIVTDETWKIHPSHRTLLGSWRFERFGGERVDAGRTVPEWNQPGLDDAAWASATPFAPDVQLSAEKVEPNLRKKTLGAIAIEEMAPDAFRIDMGRGFTGWIEVPLIGEPGTTATLTVSERENVEITYDQRNEYVFDESGKGVFRNRFNYASGRWITVRGVTAPPPLEDVRGWLVRTAYPRTGLFSCSDELLNRIYETTLWTYESLSLGGFVVDCPHRERRGYGGDAHATMETALAFYDKGAFHTKVMEDWRDVQGDDGDIPHTAPTYLGGGGPAWSGVCVTLPWEVYLAYGDRRILADNYSVMKRWLAFLDTQTTDGILHRYGHQGWGFLGDWVPPGRQQGKDERVDERSTLFFNNCYRYHCVQRVSEIAAILGKADDAARYRERAEELRRIVHGEFFDPETATYVNGEQPYLALPLLVGLTPDELRPGVMANLEREIMVEKDGHVDSGIHGTYFLLKLLTAAERSDLVHSMATQTDYPSWGHMLAQGATTFWEQWDERNSLCHSSFLSIGAWFMEGLVGIRADPAHPGFARFVVRPGVVGDLTWAEASYDSIHGPIGVAWKVDGVRFRLELVVPPNTATVLHLPADEADAVTEGAGSAADARGVRLLWHTDGEAVYEVLSGTYSFTSRAARLNQR